MFTCSALRLQTMFLHFAFRMIRLYSDNIPWFHPTETKTEWIVKVWKPVSPFSYYTKECRKVPGGNKQYNWDFLRIRFSMHSRHLFILHLKHVFRNYILRTDFQNGHTQKIYLSVHSWFNCFLLNISAYVCLAFVIHFFLSEFSS